MAHRKRLRWRIGRLTGDLPTACRRRQPSSCLRIIRQEWEAHGPALVVKRSILHDQEAGKDVSIGMFCERHYGVTFPILAKIDVNGPQASPLFTLLKRQATGVLGSRSIKWNFTKFLIDRDGNVVKRYAPFTKPQNMVKAIEALLNPI